VAVLVQLARRQMVLMEEIQFSLLLQVLVVAVVVSATLLEALVGLVVVAQETILRQAVLELVLRVMLEVLVQMQQEMLAVAAVVLAQ
jgi:hypothetical protein